jgi:hypothetical protein
LEMTGHSRVETGLAPSGPTKKLWFEETTVQAGLYQGTPSGVPLEPRHESAFRR